MSQSYRRKQLTHDACNQTCQPHYARCGRETAIATVHEQMRPLSGNEVGAAAALREEYVQLLHGTIDNAQVTQMMLSAFDALPQPGDETTSGRAIARYPVTGLDALIDG